MPEPKQRNVIIIHPDLGIGGAERLIIDVALALQSHGHRVTVYTSHRDMSHCFEEARDGTLDVRVRGNTIFPAHICGRLHVLMAVLRQLHLTILLLKEMGSILTMSDSKSNCKSESKSRPEERPLDTVFIIDQVPACVPVLKVFGHRFVSSMIRQRILFYCHFPDQLLAHRTEGGSVMQAAKALYRIPFDWFEGWALSAADRVVANSSFTRRIIGEVFGDDRLGNVRVLYPCVDVTITASTGLLAKDGDDDNEDKKKGRLWPGKKVLLSVNRFERKKDMGLAIRAYCGLSKERRKEARLVIAGGYDNRIQENVQYHRELDELATSLGLQTATSKTVISAFSIPDSIDVLFLLSVPSAFRDTLLAQSDLLLYTPANEHFGIVPVEAMRAGLPVLASNTGGPLETIVEGETGWLRDAKVPADWTAVMNKVLYEMNKEEIARISATGRARVKEKFSLGAMGNRLEMEITDMLQSERRSFNGLSQVRGLAVISGIILSVVFAFALRAL